MHLQNEVLKTLSYYDSWPYPLTAEELFTFLPVNAMTLPQFKERFTTEVEGETVQCSRGYYFLKGKTA